MIKTSQIIRRTAAIVAALALSTACSQLGQLGSVLGSATQPQASQVSGTVQGVDTRNQQIVLQATNGQQVALFFDSQTQVTYQNRSYAVTNLERGDRVTARIQQPWTGRAGHLVPPTATGLMTTWERLINSSSDAPVSMRNPNFR
jgi:hypothetical protein